MLRFQSYFKYALWLIIFIFIIISSLMLNQRNNAILQNHQGKMTLKVWTVKVVMNQAIWTTWLKKKRKIQKSRASAQIYIANCVDRLCRLLIADIAWYYTNIRSDIISRKISTNLVKCRIFWLIKKKCCELKPKFIWKTMLLNFFWLTFQNT